MFSVLVNMTSELQRRFANTQPLLKYIIIIIIIVITTTIFIVLSSSHMREFTVVHLGQSRSALSYVICGLLMIIVLCYSGAVVSGAVACT